MKWVQRESGGGNAALSEATRHDSLRLCRDTTCRGRVTACRRHIRPTAKGEARDK